MAFKSSDGKNFGSRMRMTAHEGAMQHSEPNGDEPTTGDGEDVSHQDIGEVVAQHGPADKVEIDHGGESHHVTSHHGGKKHHSEHGSAEEAHDHAKRAAGIGDQAGGEPQAQPMAQGASELPGMGY